MHPHMESIKSLVTLRIGKYSLAFAFKIPFTQAAIVVIHTIKAICQAKDIRVKIIFKYNVIKLR